MSARPSWTGSTSTTRSPAPISRVCLSSRQTQTQWLHLSFVWWLLFPFYPCPINCFILKKSALFRVGFNDIVYKNKHLLLIWHYSVQITSYLLGYFRISMWSVKTSAWSVSGLRGIHRFERALRHEAKRNFFFLIVTSVVLPSLWLSIHITGAYLFKRQTTTVLRSQEDRFRLF